MEATPEGLAAAAAAREALKQKKRSLEVRCCIVGAGGPAALPPLLPPPPAAADSWLRPRPQPRLHLPPSSCAQDSAHAAGASVDTTAAAKKSTLARPPPTLSHEVAVPPDYNVAEADAVLDPKVYGKRPLTAWVGQRAACGGANRPAKAARCTLAAAGRTPPSHSPPAGPPTLPLHPAPLKPPAGTMQEPHYSGELAKQYPFVLDPFQKAAIACIERRESVLVAAHTSGTVTLPLQRHCLSARLGRQRPAGMDACVAYACSEWCQPLRGRPTGSLPSLCATLPAHAAGKTVVAEYAIAKSLAAEKRVVYTSPLKVPGPEGGACMHPYCWLLAAAACSVRGAGVCPRVCVVVVCVCVCVGGGGARARGRGLARSPSAHLRPHPLDPSACPFSMCSVAGPVQPKVSGAGRGVWGRGPDDRSARCSFRSACITDGAVHTCFLLPGRSPHAST